ncbi:MAG: hypothetical protein LUJ09_00870 [Firmicutes bacterium]|nr:hypothetical protein [Bacillota bacterium]
MKQWFQNMQRKAMMKLQEWKNDEDGLEIVTMLVLLALGLALVGVFIGFRDQIMSTVNQYVQDFLDIF